MVLFLKCLTPAPPDSPGCGWLHVSASYPATGLFQGRFRWVFSILWRFCFCVDTMPSEHRGGLGFSFQIRIPLVSSPCLAAAAGAPPPHTHWCNLAGKTVCEQGLAAQPATRPAGTGKHRELRESPRGMWVPLAGTLGFRTYLPACFWPGSQHSAQAGVRLGVGGG